jgi:hypothetical protein
MIRGITVGTIVKAESSNYAETSSTSMISPAAKGFDFSQ